MRKILLSFADQKYQPQQQLLTFSSKPYFDEIINVGPGDIEEEFIKFNQDIFNFNRGYGYWIWKSYFIRRALEYIDDGDILFYVDAGNEIINNPQPLFDFLTNQDIILFKNRDGNPLGDVWKNSTWTKADCFNLMGCNAQEYKDGDQIDGSYILLKKTPTSIQFIDDYLKYSCNKNIITDLPNITGNNESDFIDHRHDQSILSLLAIKYNINTFESPSESSNHIQKEYPQIFNHFRRNLEWSYSLKELNNQPKFNKKYIVVSTNSHPDYIYYLPIVTQAWNKLGYETICLILNDNKELTEFILKDINLELNKIVELNPIKGIPNSSLVQVSRLFTSCLDNVEPNDLIITSDIDMIPLSNEYFDEIKSNYVFNILDAGEVNYTRHKICYIAARKKHWVELFDIKTNDINLELNNFFKEKINLDQDYYWNIDELHLFEKISNSKYYPFSNFIDRGNNILNLRNYRLDRANIPHTINMYPDKAYDCHSIRNPYNNFSILKNILKYLFSENDINNIEIFNNKFNELLRRK